MLKALTCESRISLRAAQHAMVADSETAYRKNIGALLTAAGSTSWFVVLRYHEQATRCIFCRGNGGVL